MVSERQNGVIFLGNNNAWWGSLPDGLDRYEIYGDINGPGH